MNTKEFIKYMNEKLRNLNKRKLMRSLSGVPLPNKKSPSPKRTPRTKST